jgi:hypothetical protein
MYNRSMNGTLVLLLALYLPQPQQPKPEIAQALRGAVALQSIMRDPDSFVVERVFTWNKKGEDHACYEYRSRNGYGGMNREIGYYDEHNGKTHVSGNAASRMFPTCPKHYTEITEEFKTAQKQASAQVK